MPIPTFPNLTGIDPNNPQAILDALARIQREMEWLVANLDNENIKEWLSVLTFTSDWQRAGWWDYGGSVKNARAYVWAFVPSDVVIVSAKLDTKVMSRYLVGWQPIYGTPDGYYTIKSAKIYYAVGNTQQAYYDWPASGESVGPIMAGMADITTSLWGGPWNPAAGPTVVVRSNNVTSLVQPGQRIVFGVDSGTSTDSTNGKNAAAVQFELTVIGYRK